MKIYVDATSLVALGTVGGLDLLNRFDGELVFPSVVRDEVTTEPARTNVETFAERNDVPTDDGASKERLGEACHVLNEEEMNGDVQILSAVLAHNGEVAVVSDDRRVRTVAEGFGATVTGTVGVVVRGVNEGLSEEEAKETVRRIDGNGLHMTAELREKAYDLIEEHAD